MKLKKTAAKYRGTYTYTFYDDNGKKQTVKLEPGKDGVTADDIKMLHALDDAEVYNNIKNCKPQVEEWQKKAIEEWRLNHPYEEPAKLWNVSINEMVGDDGNFERIDVLMKPEQEAERLDLDRLHEIIESLSEVQRETYRKVIIEEMSNSCVAREEQKTEAAVRKIIKRIKEILANDPELKKYFDS